MQYFNLKKKEFNSLIMRKIVLLLIFIFAIQLVQAQEKQPIVVYKLDLKDMVAPAMWRTTQKALQKAKEADAQLLLLEMNTYGGLVESADSIRTAILNLDIPSICFINNNAASAGALIAISCDSIYMRPGASFGAATVVNQTGEAMPDKYQSYMRSTMRATAEAHGKYAEVVDGDTLWVWHRDPKIAEAMVDSRIIVAGIIDSSKVLTFTPNEAIENNYCEGLAENVEEVLEKAGYTNYVIKEYKLTNLEMIIGLLMSPYLQSILIMIMIGGIYFELQTPGVGFPIAASLVAALLYFAPLYLEGIASNWEILFFIVGLILIAVEVFAIPGFGVAGVAGSVLIITGLAMAMVENIEFEFSTFYFTPVLKAFALVLGSGLIAFLVMLFSADRLLNSPALKFITLQTKEDRDDGYLSFDIGLDDIVGKNGLAITVLRPSGKISIENKIYDAISEYEYIEKSTKVKVTKFEHGQLYVISIA